MIWQKIKKHLIGFALIPLLAWIAADIVYKETEDDRLYVKTILSTMVLIPAFLIDHIGSNLLGFGNQDKKISLDGGESV